MHVNAYDESFFSSSLPLDEKEKKTGCNRITNQSILSAIGTAHYTASIIHGR